MAASTNPPGVQKPAAVRLTPPTPTNKTPASSVDQKNKKKKKPAVVNKPPPVDKPIVNRSVGAGGKGGKKKSNQGAEQFPIPLTFLYRDPRPNAGRRGQGAGGGGGGGAALDYGSGGASGDQWHEMDGDGLPIKETAEQLREKKTLFTANMAQAQAFQNNYRFQDAQGALNKVSLSNIFRFPDELSGREGIICKICAN